jgi:hypothetical protein
MNKKILIVLFLLILFFASGAFAISSNGLKSYFNFDELSGTTADDANNYQDGTLTAGATFTNIAKKGHAIDFNGSARVELSTNKYNNANYAVSLWFKANNTGGVPFTNEENRTVSTARGTFISLSAADGKFRWYQGYSGSSETTYTSTTANMDNNAWTHLVITYDGTSKRMYINGTIDGTGVQASSLAYGSPTYTFFGVVRVNGASTNDFFTGQIDEAAIFDRNLTQADVTDLYNSGAGLTYCEGTKTFASTCTIPQARITWNIYRAGTTSALTSVSMDCNVDSMDFSNQNSPVTGAFVDQNTVATCNFTRTGYDANNSYVVRVDSNKSVTITLADSTAPTMGTTTTTGFTTYTTWIKGTGNIQTTWTDTGSDVNSTGCYYTINNGTNWLLADKNATHCYKNNLTTSNGSTYQFNLKAIDNAGNTGTATATSSFVGDTNNPVTSISINQYVGRTDTNVFLRCIDSGSGCKTIYYKIDSNAWANGLGYNSLNDTNLLAYYKLDETSGVVADDSKGHDNNGTNTNASVNQAGKVGTSYSFSGNNNYITTENFSMDGTKLMTMAAWIYPTDWTANDGIWVSRGTSTEISGLMESTNLGIGLFVINAMGGQCISDDNAVNLNAWNFIAATYDGTTAKIYSNGNLVGNCSITDGLEVKDSFKIGIDDYDLVNRGFTGKIDEANIWRQALTHGDLNNIYNAGTGRAYPFVSDANSVQIDVLGSGSHTVLYYSLDNLDNNEGIKSETFTTNGYLNLNLYDENSGAVLTGNINFNGVDYNSTSSENIDLSGLTTGTYTITFSKTLYGTRTFTLDLNQYSDETINMLLLTITQGTNMKYTIFEPDQLTPYANAKVYITRPDRLNYTIGTYVATNKGKVTIFTSIFDQNYLFNINDGENIYQPVALTIKKPIDEETGALIATNYSIVISGSGSIDYNDVVNDKVVYLLPNLDLAYKIKIQDINENYFPRNYYKNYYGNPLTDTLQPYLISALTGLLTTIRSVSGTTNQPIQNINVKIYKDLQAGRTLVEDIITDAKGESLAYMVTGDQYYFEIYYNGVLVRTDTIQATSSVIYIRLDDLVYTNPILGNISANINFFPSNQTLSLADKKLIQVLKINDSNSTTTITSILIQVWNTDRNGVAGSSVLIYSDSSAYADENTITNTIDINALTQKLDGNWYDTNGMLQVVVTIITTDQNYKATFYYKPYVGFNTIYSIGFGSRNFFGCSSYYDQYGNPNPLIPCGNQLFIALFISFIMTAGLSFGLRFTSPAGLGIIFALIMGVFTYLTFVPIVLYGIMVAGLVVVIIVARGRFN